mgnify:CR=1 FL=1
MKISCTLSECPPGLFIFNGSIGFKSEYSTPEGSPDAYVVSSGEYFWGGTADRKARDALTVTPIEATAFQSVAIDDNEQ